MLYTNIYLYVYADIYMHYGSFKSIKDLLQCLNTVVTNFPIWGFEVVFVLQFGIKSYKRE